MTAVNWSAIDLLEPSAPETFVLKSALVGGDLEITVVLPTIRSERDRVLAIYLTDPVFTLRPTIAAAHLLSTFSALTGRSFPSLAVIGIGYPARDAGTIYSLRSRDLTPTPEGFPTGVHGPAVRYGFGGAESFLRALVEEVIPAVESRFPVESSDRTLLGTSFGGLFGLYTLLTKPGVFARYLLASPSIWWDERVILRYEEEWARANSDLPGTVFLAVGENEVVGDTWKNEGFSGAALTSFAMVSNVQVLTERLVARGYPSLTVRTVVLSGEYHLTVLPAAVTRGLIELFDRTSPGDAQPEPK